MGCGCLTCVQYIIHRRVNIFEKGTLNRMRRKKKNLKTSKVESYVKQKMRINLIINLVKYEIVILFNGTIKIVFERIYIFAHTKRP